MINLISVLALIDWFTEDFGFLKRWAEGYVSMKPTSAVLFIFTIFILFFMFLDLKIERKEPTKNNKRLSTAYRFLITLFTSWIFGGVCLLFLLAYMNQYIQIFKSFEFIFIPDDDPSTAISYMPSLATLFLFLFMVVVVLIYLWNTKYSVVRIKICAYIFIFTGLTAIIGTLLNIPPMFFQFKDTSNGMAVNTAVNFFLTGMLLLRVSFLSKFKYLEDESKI